MKTILSNLSPWAYFFLFLAAILIIIYVYLKFRRWPYRKKEFLLSAAEKKFYLVLLEIFGDNYVVFPKVRMADLIYVPRMARKKFYYFFNKIKSKHIDFLVCEKNNARPLIAIELDDSSHLLPERAIRDTLVNKIFKSAKFPLLHVRANGNYDKFQLLEDIKLTFRHSQ